MATVSSDTRRPLGATGLWVSPLGLGAGPLGEPSVSDEAAERLLDEALDLGLRLVDTAPSYGASERRIRSVLQRRRDEIVVSTKLGYGVAGVPDWTGPCIEAGVDQALTVLGVDVIDIAHLHSCPLDILQNSSVLEALERAVAAGKVRACAYSGEGVALDWAITSGVFAVLQASCSIVDPGVVGLRAARARGLGTIAKRPLGNAPWREDPQGRADRAVYRGRWEALGLQTIAIPPHELFVRWAAFHPAVCCAIVGTKSLQRLREDCAAVALGPLPPDVIALVDAAHTQNEAHRWQAIV